jgi:hypothetical protein
VLSETYNEEAYNPSETHAAVLVPLCNVHDKPGILFEVRGKLRTHSGEVRYGVLVSRGFNLIDTVPNRCDVSAFLEAE